MSTNTYFAHPDFPGIIFKTTQARTRHWLKLHGWTKVRRDWCDTNYSGGVMASVALGQDGAYRVDRGRAVPIPEMMETAS